MNKVQAQHTLSKLNVTTSTTRPASPNTGSIFFETDTNKLIFWELDLFKLIGYDLELNNIVSEEIINDQKLYFVRSNNEKKYIPNFLVEKNNEVDDFNQIFNGLKLIGDYLDKSILRPNNISHPKSRIEFLNVIKE